MNISVCQRIISMRFKALFAVLACLVMPVVTSCGQESAVMTPVTTANGDQSISLAAAQPAKEFSVYRIAYWEALEEADTEARAGGTVLESDEPFVVVDRGPVDVLPSSMDLPSIWVVFSQPVVPLARLGKVVTETSAMTIDPPLEGVYRWYGSRLLSFDATEEPLPQQRYTVTLSPDLQSLGGKTLEGDRSFTFRSDPLEIVSWELGDGTYWVNRDDAPLEAAGRIRLVFSHPVDPSLIGKSLSLEVDGRPVPIRTWGLDGNGSPTTTAGPLVHAESLEAIGENATLRLTLAAGALSREGALGTEEPTVLEWHSLRSFELEEIEAYSWSDPWARGGDSRTIYIRFSHPVDPEGDWLPFVSIDGYELAKENLQVWGSNLVVSGLPLPYGEDVLVRVSSGIRDLWGRTASGARDWVELGAAPSYLSIPDTGSRMLEASFDPRYLWVSQNPLALSMGIRSASGPYERIHPRQFEDIDIRSLERDRRSFRLEDLSPYLNDAGRGSVAMGWKARVLNRWSDKPQDVERWLTLQVTDLAVTTRYAPNRLVAWVTRISDGKAVPGADVTLFDSRNERFRTQSDAKGLAVFDFTQTSLAAEFSPPDSEHYRDGYGPRGSGLRILVLEKGGVDAGGDEVEFIPNTSHNMWRFDVRASEDPFRYERERPVVFMYSDRGLYRPGETVSIRFIARSLENGKYRPNTTGWTAEVIPNTWDPSAILELSGRTSRGGVGHASFTLPDDLDPGTYRVRWQREGDHTAPIDAMSFTVANFERLRFEANASFSDPFSIAGDELNASFKASYLAGGALSGSPYSASWTSEQLAWNPGGIWVDWTFGPPMRDGRSWLGSDEGRLDGQGQARLLRTSSQAGLVEGGTYRYSVEVETQDAARQSVAARASTLVHPASFHIAARLDAGRKEGSGPSVYFRESGEDLTLSGALVDPEGRLSPQGGSVEAEFIRHDWKLVRQQSDSGVHLVWEREEILEETAKLPVKAGRFSTTFQAGTGGQWEVRVRSKDQKGRAVFTVLPFYVSGSGWIWWGSDTENAINMSADRPLYKPGDSARILVRSPLEKGSYLLTLEREGIFEQRVIELDGSARSIEIPIREEYLPIVYVSLSAHTVRSGTVQREWYEEDLDKPKPLFGVLPLMVDTKDRRIDVAIEGDKAVYGPGEKASYRLSASVNGKPVEGVDIGFMAVDRGVIDLIDYHVPDPLAFFMDPARFPLVVNGADSRSLLVDPVNYELTDLFGGGGDDEKDGVARSMALNEAGEEIVERKDFRATAVFEPALVTGADGSVSISFTFPDSLTTFRCTAVASDGERFGRSEEEVRVSAPLVATAVLPRALRWRDTSELSLLLTNLENRPAKATVSLALAAAGTPGLAISPLEPDGPASKTVTVPAGGSLEVPFQVAAVGTGRASVAFTLRSASVNERILKELEVTRPLVMETVTTAGSLEGDRNAIEEGLVIPSSVPPEGGSLSVSLSASRLSLLRGALSYLFDYPYGCLEQRLSAITPLLAFGEYLSAFDLESPVADPLATAAEQADYIAAQALEDSSLPYWPGGSYPSYYVSLRFAQHIALMREKGLDDPSSEFFDTDSLLRWIDDPASLPEWYLNDKYLRAYALYVRSLFGREPLQEIDELLADKDLDVASLSLVGLAAHNSGEGARARSILTRVKRYLRPGTRGLDLGDVYRNEQGFWGSPDERYALALLFMHRIAPEDAMVSRLANTLILRMRKGRWSSTAASFWAVMAFGQIADAEAQGHRPLTATARVGDRSLLSQDFTTFSAPPVTRTARFGDRLLEDLPRDTLLPLRIAREGQGSLHYVASLRYGLPAELVTARDEGFSVLVRYTDADGKEVADGTFIAGERYRCTLVVSSSRDRSFVALRSPVPSGASIDDATFVTTASPPEPQDDQDEDPWSNDSWDDPWAAWWYNAPQQFIMDDEVRWHWDFFPAGRAELSFSFRAVTPGVYPLPPVQVECMYEEEVFGRSGGLLSRIRRAREARGK